MQHPIAAKPRGIPLTLRSSPGPETGCSACAGTGDATRARLRSSPSPETGCSPVAVAEAVAAPAGCDPHPVRRPGAAAIRRSVARSAAWLRSSPGPETGCSIPRRSGYRPHRAVAILTRSGDRVQHLGRVHRPERRVGCDPHPVRRPGAASGTPSPPSPATTRCDPHPVRRPGAAGGPLPAEQPGGVVAILTRSGDRVQLSVTGPSPSATRRLRSSPGPETGCSVVPLGRLLRRPGRLRSSPGPETGCSRHGSSTRWLMRSVAILTRSGDRVQRAHLGDGPRGRAGCDPHPVRRPGAARTADGSLRVPEGLRSSPGPETGCSRCISAGSRVRALCCDPHPVRRPGAARLLGRDCRVNQSCDPHPVRRPGAARRAAYTTCRTRSLRSSPGPETGCSPVSSATPASGQALRSSPGPETGCSFQGGQPRPRAGKSRCDPHPVRRPGAA